MSYTDGPDDGSPQTVEQVITDHPEPVADTATNPAPSDEEVADDGE